LVLNFSVCEPQDGQAKVLEEAISVAVISLLRQVNLAINLDHQFGGVAVKIDNIAADDLLAAKMKAS